MQNIIPCFFIQNFTIFFKSHYKSILSHLISKIFQTTDTNELETDDKVEPVRQWVNSGGHCLFQNV